MTETTQNFSEAIEARFQKIEMTLNQVLGNHETFMQGLEDAARELMKNDLIRVTIPSAFREKLTQYIALREAQRAAKEAGQAARKAAELADSAVVEEKKNETPSQSV